MEREKEKERQAEKRWEANLSDTDRVRFADYNRLVRNPSVQKYTQAWYANRFAIRAGRGIEKAGENALRKFRWLYSWEEDVANPQKGFYLFGGTGCGKTTLAKTFARKYRVVSCIDVTADFEADATNGLQKYLEGNICFDDLGAEQSAYGKWAMVNVILSRYDAMMKAKEEAAKKCEKVEEIAGRITANGWSVGEWNDVEKCYAERGKEASIQLFGIGNEYTSAVTERDEFLSRIPFTCFTSNLRYEDLFAKYDKKSDKDGSKEDGKRIVSRIHEMCDFIDFSDEPDHRING